MTNQLTSQNMDGRKVIYMGTSAIYVSVVQPTTEVTFSAGADEFLEGGSVSPLGSE